MADPRRHYFVATGPDAMALLVKIDDLFTAHHARAKAFCDRYGVRYHMQSNGVPTGILLDQGAAVPEGFKVKRNIHHEGKGYQLAEPVGNTKVGREAKKAAAEVGTFSASAIVTKHYGVDRHWFIVTGNSSWHATGWANIEQKLITLQVPADHEHPLPQLHPELREIEYSQYVAITEEGAPAPPEAAVPAPLWRYTCKGKGGEYELIGVARGAGTSKQGESLAVYRDTATGCLYYRQMDDFDNRMERTA